jgi:hypothetical protein
VKASQYRRRHGGLPVRAAVATKEGAAPPLLKGSEDGKGKRVMIVGKGPSLLSVLVSALSVLLLLGLYLA